MCLSCGCELIPEKAFIYNGWVYCPFCLMPVLDMKLQDGKHWSRKCKVITEEDAIMLGIF